MGLNPNPLALQIQKALPRILSDSLVHQRWFGGKARRLRSVIVLDALPMDEPSVPIRYLLLQAAYAEGDPETYALPLAYAAGDDAAKIRSDKPEAVVAELEGRQADGGAILYDALRENVFCGGLLDSILRRRRFRGLSGEIVASPTRTLRQIFSTSDPRPEPSLIRAEQSNSSIVYGRQLILKVFRRVEEGKHPDVEVTSFLTEQAGFSHVPPVAGVLEYLRHREEPIVLGILQGYVPNQGDAWQYTLDHLKGYFEQVTARYGELPEAPCPPGSVLELIGKDLPETARELVGTYLEAARLLGQRTAEMHVALASNSDLPDFAPEPFSTLYQRSIYQAMRNLTGNVFELLRKQLPKLPDEAADDGRQVLSHENEVLQCFRAILDRKITALRTRLHGDFHLGQVLYTGNDFVFFDFEGEPARALSERRIKRSPLRDVAGMLRSFHYAASAGLGAHVAAGAVRPESLPALESWARYWYLSVSLSFLSAYRSTVAGTPALPRTTEEFTMLMNAFLLEKAIYELGYELNNRPDWVRLPLRGILDLVGTLN